MIFHDFFGAAPIGVPGEDVSVQLEKQGGLVLCSPCQRLFHPEWKRKKHTNKSCNFQGSEKSPASIG